MALANLILVPLPDFRPVSNITPFTVRDGMTFLAKFEALSIYVSTVLVPALDTEIKEMEDAWQEQVTFLTDYINQAINAIINDSIDIQDPVVAEMVNDPESLSRQALDDLYAAKSIQTLIETGRLSEDELNETYAPKSIEAIVTTGRLSETELDNAYAEKSVQTTVETGRLSETELANDFAPKEIADVVNTGRLSETELDATYADKSVQETVETGRLSEAEINALFGPIIKGEAGKEYGLVGLALRNTGPGWAPINDSGHAPTNVAGVSQTIDYINIDHSALGVSKVTALVVVPDETLTGLFDFGTSVGIDATRIYCKRRESLSDYISYNGSAWVALRGRFDVSFSAGIITLTHDNVFNLADGGDNMAVSVSGRDGASGSYVYSIDASVGIGNDQIGISVRDYAGALVSTPNANMRFVINRGVYEKFVDPDTIDTATYPGSNLWVIGIFEV